MKKSLTYFITEYLKNAPLFMSFIRPQEALLFYENKKYIKPPVLDFGCGDGFFAQLAFNKIEVGIDLYQNPRVNEAKNKKIYKKIVLYDGKKIPIDESSFKAVVSNCVLEHIPDVNQSVSEIYRVLKKDGYFITSVMTDNWSNMMFGSNIFGPSYARWLNKRQEHHSLFSESKWDKVFLKSGFKIEKKIGYVTKKQAIYLDIFHYLSIISLLSYRLIKKWVPVPFLNLYWRSFILDKLKTTKISHSCAAVFYILRKK